MSLAQVKLDARDYLEGKDAKLLCSNFKGAVTIKHQDNSQFFLENAIMEEKSFGSFKLLFVWTEHCGHFFFFTEDLESWYYEPYENENTKKRSKSRGHQDERADDH